MTQNKEKTESKLICDNTIGTWYNVCYLKHWSLYGRKPIFRCEDEVREYCKYEELMINNINGLGIGCVFFINKNNQMVVLPWCAIISMVPVDKK